MIDDLISRFPEENKVAIVCLYCDYRDQGKQTLVNIMGSLLKQLLFYTGTSHILQDVIKLLAGMKRKGQQIETADILQILKATLAQFNRSFICIDALDELQADVRKTLLETLHNISTTVGTVRFFLTGRPHIATELSSRLQIQQAIDIKAQQDDVRAYLLYQISQDANPDAMNGTLKEEIMSTVTEKSMDMWVAKFHIAAT